MSQGLAALLSDVPRLQIVDVGAMEIGDPPYAPLLTLPNTTVVGFEPNPEECARLNAKPEGSKRFVPTFVGDGRTRTFHWSEWAATSSLYPPHRRLLDRFSDLGELVVTKETSQVETKRLDDIPECRGSDFIKIDVQGATLDVIRGGNEVLKAALVVQCEVEFVPLYEGEPLFAEVDQAMRELGYLFHKFTHLSTGTFAPLRRKANAPPNGQVLWTDAVYVKSFLDFAALGPEELLKLALMVEIQYGSRDLALLALQHREEKVGDGLWDRYSTMLTGVVKERPPL
jgi:FkbM family methyltransferase